jgi:hypothetical protein
MPNGQLQKHDEAFGRLKKNSSTTVVYPRQINNNINAEWPTAKKLDEAFGHLFRRGRYRPRYYD